MYCSISEAWNLNNNIIEKYTDNVTDNKIEKKNNENPVENNLTNKILCIDVLNHIVNCKDCQKILNEKFNKQKLNTQNKQFDINNSLDIFKSYYNLKLKDCLILLILFLIIILLINIICK